MVELEHARALLEQMGLDTAAQLLDAQLEQSLHAQHTYVQFLDALRSCEPSGTPTQEPGNTLEIGPSASPQGAGRH